MMFISLKLKSVSLEALLWSLRSLKNDEMIPSERAIQSRMKEVFDFKPNSNQWANLMSAVQNRATAILNSTLGKGFNSMSDIEGDIQLPNFLFSYTTD